MTVGVDKLEKQQPCRYWYQIYDLLPGNWSRLGRATTGFAIVNFGTKAFNFLLLVPVYSHFLNPEQYGIVSLSEAMAVVVASIYATSFEASIQRFYHLHEDPLRRRACINTLIQLGMAIMGFICLLAFTFGPWAIGRLLPHLGIPFYPYLALAIGTLALNQIVSYRLSLYQAEQRTRKYLSLSLFLFAAIAVCTVTFIVVLRRGALGMLAGKFLPTALVAALAIYLFRSWLTPSWDKETLRAFTKFSLPMAAYPLIVLGLNIADRLILQHYRTVSEVGIYSLAYGVGMAMSLIALSLYQSWTPVFYKAARQGDASKSGNARLVSIALLIKVAFAIVGVSLSPLFFAWLIDPRYRQGAAIVPFIICGYLMRGFTFSFHVPLLAAGRTLATSASGAVALAVNLAINFAFIPTYGFYAAAYATFIAYAVELVIVYFVAQRIYPLPYARRKIAASLLLLFLILLLNQSPLRGNIPMVTALSAIAVIGVLHMARGTVAAKVD
jgi:O-antigen/teichoic acid export membrane protein